MILSLLAVFFVILNILDVKTTQKILKNGGYEANPIARLLMKFHLFIPTKIIMVIIILFVMFKADNDMGMMTGVICCGIYIPIILSNYRTIRLQLQEIEMS